MNIEFMKLKMELHRVEAGKIEQEIRIAEREQEIERLRVSLTASDQRIAEIKAKLEDN
jgi:uncharacterized coiled-coil protein SlyX